MPRKPREPTRLERAEAWRAFIARTVFAIAGLVILLMQAAGVWPSILALTVAGISLCGVAVAEPAAMLFKSIRGGSDE